MTALGPRARLLAVLALANACGTNAEPHATATAAAPTFESEAAAGRVTVELLGIEGIEGNLLVALFRDANGFPEGGARAFDKRVLEPQPGVLRAVFDAVPAGPFAVAAFHDEDRDFELDKGLFGPTEGYGFSRDARKPFGPPSFDAAKLTLAAGQHQLVRIHMRY